MSVVAHSPVLLGVAVAGMVAVASSHPKWLLRVAQDQPLYRAICLQPDAATPEQDDARYQHALYNRFAAKYRVVRCVIRGEQSLVEAAACFRRINDECAAMMGCTPATMDLTDPVAACQQVILWVESELRAKAHPRTDEVLGALKAELRRVIEQHSARHAADDVGARVSGAFSALAPA